MRTVRLTPLVALSLNCLIPVVLAALAFLSRLPFATKMLYNWDSVNFARAMVAFDVTRHAPHPPGYLWYVGLARILDLVFHNANTSLVAISIGFTVLAVVALCELGRAQFGRPTGLIAALLLLTGVTFWSYGVIALSYMTLAFFSIVVADRAFRIIGAPQSASLSRNALLLSLSYALSGGFRPDLLLFLAPLWLLAMVRVTWRDRLLNTLVVVSGTLLWLIPTIWLSGGVEKYSAVLAAYFSRDVLGRYSVTHRGWRGLWVNVRDLANYLAYVFYAQGILLAAAIVWWFGARQWREPRWWWVVFWIMPAFLFYTFVHIGDPGYVFSITPGLCLLGARFLTAVGGLDGSGVSHRWPLGRPLVLTILALTLAINTGIFLFVDKPLTASGIRRNDHSLAARVAYIRAHYRSDETVLLSYMSYKHVLYYLPDYPTSQWVNLFSRRQHHLRLTPEMRYLLLVDRDLWPLVRSTERWLPVTLSVDVGMYQYDYDGEDELFYGPEGIAVR